MLELSEDAEVSLHWGAAPSAGSEWQPIGGDRVIRFGVAKDETNEARERRQMANGTWYQVVNSIVG